MSDKSGQGIVSLVLQVRDEPAVQVTGKVEAKPHRLPTGM